MAFSLLYKKSIGLVSLGSIAHAVCMPTLFLHRSFLHPSAGETNPSSEKSAPALVTGRRLVPLGSTVRLCRRVCSAVKLQLSLTVTSPILSPLWTTAINLPEYAVKHTVVPVFLSRQEGERKLQRLWVSREDCLGLQSGLLSLLLRCWAFLPLAPCVIPVQLLLLQKVLLLVSCGGQGKAET